MCGIFFYKGKQYNKNQLLKFLLENKHRGPDNTKYKIINDIFLGFNRLSVNGLDEISNQPFYMKGCYLICNGEIYNYKKLIKKYELETEYVSRSDCEIIIHLYKKIGFDKMIRELDGEFAFVLYDEINDYIYISRDPLGIRSLYYCIEDNQIAVASEMKSLVKFKNVTQFPSGYYWMNDIGLIEYYKFEYKINHNITEKQVLKNIHDLLIEGVEKRLMSERKIACLLSGGLDSTLVTAIVCNKIGAKNLNTYSIGLEGSVDLEYAKKAAEYLGTNHTNIVLSEEDFLYAIEPTIKQIESWDTTSVRASVGNYLVSLYIKNNSDDTILFCGDVSDEIFASYRGFMSADTDENLLKENTIMLKNIRYFDVLRSDKSISGAGLEARVPYGDIKLVDFVMSLPAQYKKFDNNHIEKYYLRKAFHGYLPDFLLWRRKEAFSDGVSSLKRSWFQIIKEHVDKKITDNEYNIKLLKYIGDEKRTPYDKESLYYREIFDKYYKNKDNTIPYYWRHPFSTILDPSARLLNTY
jgi:asparagine synthase (glutamine-hydrolysing)